MKKNVYFISGIDTHDAAVQVDVFRVACIACLDKIERATEELSRRYDVVLLEGAGGLMVPLTDELLTIDYIAQKGYPLLFVTSGKLGSINHTLLSLEAIKNRGIKLDTVLYNLYPTVEDRTIQEDTQLFIQRYLKKDFPETKFCMVPEL